MNKTIAEQIAEILNTEVNRIKKVDPCELTGELDCVDGVSCPKCREEFWNRRAVGDVLEEKWIKNI